MTSIETSQHPHRQFFIGVFVLEYVSKLVKYQLTKSHIKYKSLSFCHNQIFFNCRLLHEDLQPRPGWRPVLQQQGRYEQEPLQPGVSPALAAVLPGVLQKHGGPAPPQTLLPRDQGEQLQRVEADLQPCN